METSVRWEVWVTEDKWSESWGTGEVYWRFNACFNSKERADGESQWYIDKGYNTDVRVRTTRFQNRKHFTTGK